MSILTKQEIEHSLFKENTEEKKLVVTPILNKKQINGSGIDLRLSNQFIVFKSENISSFDIRNKEEKETRRYQSHVVTPFFKYFILHPKSLVLASTLEYVSMPENVFGTLEGRSSWARLGLIIATACAIDPGYKGCITLELSNLGNLPLYLYPGIRIAKLILAKTSSPVKYDTGNKKYFVQIGPEFSKANKDDEIDIITGQV